MNRILLLLMVKCTFLGRIMTPPTMKSADSLTAMVYVEGGREPFTYLWQNGSTDSSCRVSQKGGYTFMVTVTDGNGCVARDTLVIK